MAYILKNNKIDKRYEEKFFEIIKENLPAGKLGLFNNLLSRKTEIIRGLLSDVRDGKLEADRFDAILSFIFSVRRHKKQIIETVSVDILNDGFNYLSDSKKSAEIRLARFLAAIPYENVIVKRDIALEVLHFCEPEKNVLWTSWVYRQDNGTGCLPYMADFLKRTWDGNPYIMPFSIKEMKEEIDYLYELSNKNDFAIEPPYGIDILLSYMYSDYVYKMVYAESKSLSIGVPDGFTLMKKLLGIEKLGLREAEAV